MHTRIQVLLAELSSCWKRIGGDGLGLITTVLLQNLVRQIDHAGDVCTGILYQLAGGVDGLRVGVESNKKDHGLTLQVITHRVLGHAGQNIIGSIHFALGCLAGSLFRVQFLLHGGAAATRATLDIRGERVEAECGAHGDAEAESGDDLSC